MTITWKPAIYIPKIGVIHLTQEQVDRIISYRKGLIKP